MTRKETIKWLESLKSEIGKSEHRTLWHYAEAIDMAIEALSADTVATIQTGQTYGKSAYIKELAEVVQCKDCRHAGECHKNVQYTRNELNTVTIGYSPIEWCSRGERREP